MIIIGISTCDTCRKARAQFGESASWRDLRKVPLSPEEVEEILGTFGERAINRSSATWRQLDAAERARPPHELLLAHPTLLKRPLIRDGADLHIGWTPEVQAKLAGK